MKLKFDVTIQHPWGVLEVVKVRDWSAISAAAFVGGMHPHSAVISTVCVRYSF